MSARYGQGWINASIISFAVIGAIMVLMVLQPAADSPAARNTGAAASVSYVTDIGDLRRLVGLADNVFVAKIVEHRGMHYVGGSRLPETMFSAEVIENLKGELAEHAIVNQQGGFNGLGHKMLFDDDPLLEVGSVYVLATRYSTRGGWHTVIPHRGHERLTIGTPGSGGQARYTDESASHLNEYVEAIANQIPYRPSGDAAPAMNVEADGEEKAPEGAEAPAVKRETFSEMSRLATVSGSPSVFTTTFFVELGPAVGVSFTLAVTTTLLPGSNLLEDGQTRTTGDMMVEIPVGAAVIASSPPADEITVPDVHRGASSYSVIWRDCEWVVDVPTSVRIELRGESQILPTQLRATYQDAVTGLVRSDWVWMSIGMPARPGRLSDPMDPTP